jgi:hypothetical protein
VFPIVDSQAGDSPETSRPLKGQALTPSPLQDDPDRPSPGGDRWVAGRVGVCGPGRRHRSRHRGVSLTSVAKHRWSGSTGIGPTSCRKLRVVQSGSRFTPRVPDDPFRFSHVLSNLAQRRVDPACGSRHRSHTDPDVIPASRRRQSARRGPTSIGLQHRSISRSSTAEPAQQGGHRADTFPSGQRLDDSRGPCPAPIPMLRSAAARIQGDVNPKHREILLNLSLHR